MDGNEEKLVLTCTWMQPGTYSRCDQWHFGQRMINSWLGQKKYPEHNNFYKIDKLCRKFARKHGFKGSNSDNILFSHQNMKHFREFVNELKKDGTGGNQK